MTTTDPTTTELYNLPGFNGFDPEGHPMFDHDELDDRYQSLIERIQAVGGRGWSDIDCAVSALLSPSSALPFAEEVLELLEVLINRERGRVRLIIAEQERRLEELRRGLGDIGGEGGDQ